MSDMLPRPEPREPFKRALRSQLMAQAATTLVRRETIWTRFQRASLRPAAAFAAVVLVLVAGTGKAAADSLPGDAVFGLKTAAEHVQFVLAIDDPTRLRVLAEQADHRLAELAEAVSVRHASLPAAQEAYATAVQKLTVAVEVIRARPNVSDDMKTAAEDVVDGAHQRHAAVLTELKNKSSNEEQPEVDRATQESDKLHASGRPPRTAEPSDKPEPSRTPQPTKTASPSRTPEPTRTGRPTETPEPTRTGGEQGERTSTPSPAVRR